MLDDSMNDVEGWLAKKAGRRWRSARTPRSSLGNGIVEAARLHDLHGRHAGAHVGRRLSVIRQITTGVSGGFAVSKPGDKFIDLVQSLAERAPEGRRLRDEPAHRVGRPKARRRTGQLPVHPELCDEPERLDPRPRDRGAPGHGGHRREQLSIAFANFAEGYEIKDHKVGVRVLRDPYTAKPYVQFYTTKRVGGDVVNFQAITLLKFGITAPRSPSRGPDSTPSGPLSISTLLEYSMKDLMSLIHPVRAVAPVATAADNTAVVSQIIDRMTAPGFESLTFVIATGAIPDADATFTVLVEHGDRREPERRQRRAGQAARRNRSAGVVHFLGRQQVLQDRLRRAASSTVADDHAGGNTSATLMCVIALLGHPHATPTANPPVAPCLTSSPWTTSRIS
jgi:hypothetical protein